MAEQPKSGFYIAVALVVARADWVCGLSQRSGRSQAGRAGGAAASPSPRST